MVFPCEPARWLTIGHVLCVAATLYWVCSFFVLLLRTCVPAFAALTEYGGRQPDAHPIGAAPSPRRPRTSRVPPPLRLLQTSWLGACRVDRQWAFAGFYLSGLATCAGLWWACPFVPTSLALFTVHCAVRLAESVLGRSPRTHSEDEVTLFAALAGCSFYVFASISSCPFKQDDGAGSCTAVRTTLVCLYVLICVGQTWCHHVLRLLRSQHHVRLDGRESHSRGVCLRGGRVWRYRFPHVIPFTWVQEPHYLAEVLLYTIQALVLLPVHTSVRVSGEGTSLLQRLLDGSPTGATCGVAVFTLLNLAITATQHRRFWIHLNTERVHLAVAVETDGKPTSTLTVPPPEKLPRWVLLPGVY